MKFKALILIIIAGIAFSCKPAHHDIRISQFLIDSIKSQEIPDSRVEVFLIKASYIGNDLLLTGRTTKPEAVAKLEARLRQQQVSFTDSIVRLPDPALGDKTWALVNLTVANLRTEPAHAAEMATQALIGTPLKVLQKEKTWYLVQTPDQYIAWIDSVEIISLTASEIKAWKNSDRLIYLKDNGIILNSTERNARPVSDMVMGGIVTIDKNGKQKGSSIPVELPDGRKGFVNSKDCRNFNEWSAEVRPDTVAMLNCAFNLFGRPYLWGGTSSKATDCSGFTKNLYMMSGLILSRDASQQVAQGTEIAKEAIWKGLKAGDLLFFGRTATKEKPERVTHVGMYIGDSEFIHNSAWIKTNSLDSSRTNFKPYYHTNLLHVRRIIGSSNQPVSFKAHPWYN